MFGHIPEPLAKIPFPLITCWEILDIKVSNILRKQSATEAAVKNLPHFIFGARLHKLQVRKVIKNSYAEQG